MRERACVRRERLAGAGHFSEYHRHVTREEILSMLAARKAQLDRFSVSELSLFGSHARNEANESSDIDFVVEFREKSFGHYMDLKEYLEELFQRRVDLVLKSAIKPRLREVILREAVRAA
jgi:predicted nucleotidyltransferase